MIEKDFPYVVDTWDRKTFTPGLPYDWCRERFGSWDTNKQWLYCGADVYAFKNKEDYVEFCLIWT